MKIEVSFKNTTNDMLLYQYVNAQEEKSMFVKSALSFYIKHIEKEKVD